MSYVSIKNVSFQYRLLEGDRSLKNKLFFSRQATGGTLQRDQSGEAIITAISNFSLEIKKGERIGLLGHNGSGKSTLLRLIAGIYFPASGTIEVKGKVTPLLDIATGMLPDATGIENIYLRGHMLGMTNDQINAYMDDIIDFSGLGDLIHIPIKNYSTGMRIRLAFTISTSTQPEILLIDEGIGAGDASFQQKATERLTKFLDTLNILVFTSHSKELLEQYCNKIVVLKKGQIDDIKTL